LSKPAFVMPVSDRRVLKYLSIAVDIRDRIARGSLKPGQQLPASASLAKQYGVALMTVRQALALLEQEGTVEARHGAGTFVVDGPRRNHKRFGKLLLIEDDEALCETVAAALRDFGHKVDVSLTGRDALARLKTREPYDAIVLDLRLPDMNGLEIVEYIKTSRPSLGLIVASGYLEQEDVLRTAERWPIMMLRKPYAASDLIERLSMLLQQRREYARV
jgi:CheY-like chemotaxis protein